MNQHVEQEVLPPESRVHPAQALAKARLPEGTMIVDNATVALLNKSEIDQQIATAHAYPRSITTFADQATALVCLTEEMAAACIYSLPRDGKTIEGPSARFAEIMLHAWGNARAGARIIAEGKEFITAQGVFHDLEKNSAVTFEVQRRITGKHGRFSADMIGVTGNAACSIALRNAVLKGIPKAFWNPMYEAARRTIMGDFKTIANRRADAIAAFVPYGVTEQEIFKLLGVKGTEDIGGDQLVTLRGVLTALKEGDTTPEEAFGRNKAPAAPSAPAAPAAPSASTPAAPTAPTRQAGQPRTDDTPYDQMGRPVQHDATTGEVFESFDVDAWLKNVSAALAQCATQAELEQAWDNEAAGPIDDGLVPSLYSEKADGLFQEHVARCVALAEGKKPPKQSSRKSKAAPVAPSAPSAKPKEPLSNDESDAYLKGLNETLSKIKTQDVLDDIETDFKENWKPRMFPPDFGKAEKAISDKRTQLLEYRG